MGRSPRTLASLVALAAASCGFGGGGAGGGNGGAPSLRVAAAASLRELCESTAPGFCAGRSASLVFSFEASSMLARQIAAGAAFDAFLSADSECVERVRDLADPDSIGPFLKNRLVLVAREGLESPPRDPEALASFGGRLALAGPAVPAGRYARAYLERQGVLGRLLRGVAGADDVRATLALVESGAADVAIVYATDALLARRARVVFTVPDADDPGVRYVACALRSSSDPALAREYVRSLFGDEFQSAALRMGFLRVPR